MLHLTNGDCAIPAQRAAGVDGEVPPWREVLRDGPVPALDPNRRGRAVLAGEERWGAEVERWIVAPASRPGARRGNGIRPPRRGA